MHTGPIQITRPRGSGSKLTAQGQAHPHDEVASKQRLLPRNRIEGSNPSREPDGPNSMTI